MEKQMERFEWITSPSSRLIEDIKKIKGDILLIGAGGKIGPDLAVMAARASREAGISRRVIAASMFDHKETVDRLRNYGVEAYEVDLFDNDQRNGLPDCPNIIYLAGKKFGTTQNQSLTWAINVLLPAKICERYPHSRFVVFSTGNVYGDVPVLSGGSTEMDEPRPDGEYGQTCLGRERVFEYYAAVNKTPSLLFRLNYAVDLRYGVLFDIANAVYQSKPVNLSRGVFNCIWQGDVCEYAIRSLLLAENPAAILNVTGPQCISTRWAAKQFGLVFRKEPVFVAEERAMGLYSNTTKLGGLLGMPRVSLDEMIRWQSQWILAGGTSIDAPTHFEQADGKY